MFKLTCGKMFLTFRFRFPRPTTWQKILIKFMLIFYVLKIKYRFVECVDHIVIKMTIIMENKLQMIIVTNNTLYTINDKQNHHCLNYITTQSCVIINSINNYKCSYLKHMPKVLKNVKFLA